MSAGRSPRPSRIANSWRPSCGSLAPTPISPPIVERTVAELQALRARGETGETDDYAALARAGAACFYGWARLELDLAPQLERCAIVLARSAQTRAAASRAVGYRAPS